MSAHRLISDPKFRVVQQQAGPPPQDELRDGLVNSEQLASADRYALVSLLDDLAEPDDLQRIRVLHKCIGGAERDEKLQLPILTGRS